MTISRTSIRRHLSSAVSPFRSWTVKFDGPDLEGRLLDADGGTVAFFETYAGTLWVYGVATFDGGLGPLWAWSHMWRRKPVWHRA